ncbi:MAG: MarR family transcriptional regulator [Silicimonas sp.]|nr:MarR family transcriptional regulator [Silicimonas sp.]
MLPTRAMRYRLHASLGYNLSLAARLQERRLDDALKTLGLTRITWCVLLGVGNEGLEQPSEIANFVGIDRTAASRALRGMEEDGLIVRTGGDGDKRTRRVQLTAFGQSCIDKGTPFAVANNEAMRAKLTAREHQVLSELLGKLNEGENAELSTF